MFSRVFRLLDPAAFSECFGCFLDILEAKGAKVIAIDGKTLRRSFESAERGNPLAVVTAFATVSRLVVRQRRYRAGDSDSEIVAARAFLECHDLRGSMVTADALHCQGETARLIRDRGGDYLLRLKANRPALHGMVKDCFSDAPTLAELASAMTRDADHGRIETRRFGSAVTSAGCAGTNWPVRSPGCFQAWR